jgi:excisionase family DNA binding protein
MSMSPSIRQKKVSPKRKMVRRRQLRRNKFGFSNTHDEPSTRNLVAGSAAKNGNRGRDQPRFFTIYEVARDLGVSTRTVRRWIAAGELAHHRFGSSVRISRIDLEMLLASHRQGQI